MTAVSIIITMQIGLRLFNSTSITVITIITTETARAIKTIYSVTSN